MCVLTMSPCVVALWTPGSDATSASLSIDMQEREIDRLKEREKEEELRKTPLVWTPEKNVDSSAADEDNNLKQKVQYKPVRPGLSATLPRAKPKRDVCTGLCCACQPDDDK